MGTYPTTCRVWAASEESSSAVVVQIHIRLPFLGELDQESHSADF